MGEVTVGVKYCGGCNPRYDRAATVKTLAASCLPARFVPAEAGECWDLLLVVCGCPAQCADTRGLTATQGRYSITKSEDGEVARLAILKLTPVVRQRKEASK